MNMLLHQLHYGIIFALILLGMYGLLLKKHFLKKIIAMNIRQVGVIFLFISLAYRKNALAPIETPGAQFYVNPLPHALMLTAIVVSLATTGVALALMLKIHENYGSLDEEEILEQQR
ncbi:MAG: cation:proton antiporter subunit C [Bdellovibrionota bacterium]